MGVTEQEISTQPECWARAAALGADVHDQLPGAGERVAVTGCGTSWFMAMAYAAARESARGGETDAYPSSEMPLDRAYDRVVAISRSGTTTEVVRLLGSLPDGTPSVVLTAVPGSPVTEVAGSTIALEWADEQSVVQTRFATSALTLLLATLGISPDIDAARTALVAPLPDALERYRRIAFLGTGWTVGLAHEAALKVREAAGAWTEAYPAMEYRHGPISAASNETLVWPIGAVDVTVLTAAQSAGSTIAAVGQFPPLASLVLAQRAAVFLAVARGLDPDRPLNLTRSVVLP